VSAPPPPSDASGEVAPPRRLDPRTLVVALLRNVGPSGAFALVAALGWARGRDFPVGLLVGAVAALAVVVLVLGWLQWRAFTYQVLPRQVVISSGLVRRTRRFIPAERIQDVSLKQGPLHRLFGLAEVRIETGGGVAEEGRLDSVRLAEAHRLREVLRALRAPPTAADGAAAPSAATTEPEATLFRIGPLRLALAGLFSFSLVWMAAVFAAYEYADRLFDWNVQTILGALDLAGRDFRTWEDLRVALVVAGATLALGVAAGMVRTVLRDWGFTLTYGEAAFRVRRGLLTRTEVVVARRQIQLGLVEHGTLSGAFGWRALKVQTMGAGEETSGRRPLLPFNRPEEVAPVAALAGLPAFEPAALRRVSRRHAIAGLVWYVAAPAAAAVAASLVFPPALLSLALLPGPALVALLRPDRHRYALAATSVQVRRGVIGRRDWIVPYRNVQVLSVTRGPWQRLFGLATVRIDTAGAGFLDGGPHVHDLDETVAARLARDLAARIHAAEPRTPA
jgi:putative membrane protein